MKSAVLVVAMFVAMPSSRLSDVATAAWLAGCWAQRDATFVYEEQWMAPAGGVMLGMSRTLLNDRLAGREFLSIEFVDDTLAYVAVPSGQARTVFTLADAGERRLVFENPAHDFPQRIVYALQDDLLAVRVEGGGKGFDLALKREPCAN